MAADPPPKPRKPQNPMAPQSRPKSPAALTAGVSGLMLVLAGMAQAQTDGVWNYNGNGNWTDDSRWVGTHATGVGAVAEVLMHTK